MGRVQRLAYLALATPPVVVFLWEAADQIRFWMWWRAQTGHASIGGTAGLIMMPALPLALMGFAMARQWPVLAALMAAASLFGSYVAWLALQI
jgi:hypothetical protein